jgi:hypothetical protein
MATTMVRWSVLINYVNWYTAVRHQHSSPAAAPSYSLRCCALRFAVTATHPPQNTR